MNDKVVPIRTPEHLTVDDVIDMLDKNRDRIDKLIVTATFEDGAPEVLHSPVSGGDFAYMLRVLDVQFMEKFFFSEEVE